MVFAATPSANAERPLSASTATPSSAGEPPEVQQNLIEQRILGAIDRATGARIDTGASGERGERWNGSGRFHIHPEELKMQQAIKN